MDLQGVGGGHEWGSQVAAQGRWGLWVSSGPCPPPSHPPVRDASALAIWTLLLIFLGSKQPPRIHLQVPFPRAGCVQLSLEVSVPPGDMALQVPGRFPEEPRKKHTTWLLCSVTAGLWMEEIKMMVALIFLISV